MNTENTIGPMTRVALEIDTGDSARPTGPVDFEFIFGIGVNGLCGLEMRLAGKKAGQETRLEVEPGTMEELFGHLGCSLMRAAGRQPPFALKIRIKEVAPAKPREVVKAMAENTECGCDCGCGCF